jgi:hypothetical protein
VGWDLVVVYSKLEIEMKLNSMVNLRSHGLGIRSSSRVRSTFIYLHISISNMPFRLPVRLELDSGFKLEIQDKHRHRVDQD